MLRDYSAFTERFRALTDGETNRAVAKRLGITDSHVSHLRTGRRRATQDLVLRICDEYGVNVQEWMNLAGYNNDPLSNLVLSHEPPSGYTPLKRFREGMHFLGLSLPVYALPSEFPGDDEAPQEVDARLKSILERALLQRDRTKGHKSGARLAVA